MVEFDYESALYDDGGTGLEKDLVFKSLFVDDEPGFHASATEEFNAIAEESTVPDTVTVTSVTAEDVGDGTVHFTVYTPDVTLGTQPKRQGGDSVLALRGNDHEFGTYRVAVKQA